MSNYRIKNWLEFQHYKDRNPPWIKLHFTLLTSRDWVSLDDASRVLAVACMLLASRNEGVIPDDPEYVERMAYLNQKPNFKPLVKCGFLVQESSSLDNPISDNREETETETETEQLADASRVLADSKSDFETFWSAYPKKKSKGVAVKAFSKAMKITTLDVILSSLQNLSQSADWLKEGGKYIPYPSTWLNAQGWEDQVLLNFSKSGLPVPSQEELKAMGPRWGTNRAE